VQRDCNLAGINEGLIMKTDAQLKKDVMEELQWDPSFSATRIGVAVSDGVVTLTGHVDTFAEKRAVERAVQRVHSVRTIAMEIDVKLDPRHERSDSEIAMAVESALKWHADVPDDRIRIKVEQGRVVLEGEVDWDYQRQSAAQAVACLTGVIGVDNEIRLRPSTIPGNVADCIRDALTRHAEQEARQIDITVKGAVVTLRGRVDSWAERSAAQAAAWSALGVQNVVNEIKVQPSGSARPEPAAAPR
jgi:osmotically-inducible protein OsmY